MKAGRVSMAASLLFQQSYRSLGGYKCTGGASRRTHLPHQLNLIPSHKLPTSPTPMHQEDSNSSKERSGQHFYEKAHTFTQTNMAITNHSDVSPIHHRLLHHSKYCISERTLVPRGERLQHGQDNHYQFRWERGWSTFRGWHRSRAMGVPGRTGKRRDTADARTDPSGARL